MRVALTGASGFTGRYVADELTRRGVSWVALDGNVTDSHEMDRVVGATVFDRLIHLAAVAFAGGGDWGAFYQVNQLGTYNLLEAVARHRPGAICLLASSATVYGHNASGIVSEGAPLHPSNHYAVSKLAMEQGAALWRDQLDIRIVRPFNYTGVGQESRYLIPKIVDHFALRLPEIELGNIHVQRDFGDVRSVAAAYCDLISVPEQGLVTNIATGTLSSIHDIMDILQSLTGHTIDIRVNPAFLRAGDVPVLGGDTTHLCHLAPEWTPIALRDTLAWMLEEAEAKASPST